jgi:hypothetical protein
MTSSANSDHKYAEPVVSTRDLEAITETEKSHRLSSSVDSTYEPYTAELVRNLLKYGNYDQDDAEDAAKDFAEAHVRRIVPGKRGADMRFAGAGE